MFFALTFLFFVLFATASWSMDSLELDGHVCSVKEDTIPLLPLNLEDKDACAIDLVTQENKALPREMWWMIAVHSGDEYYKLAPLFPS